MRSLWGRKPDESTIIAVLAISIAVAMWGLAPVANRYLVGNVTQQVTPGALLALRFSLSAVILLPLAIRARVDRWQRNDQLTCLAATLCGVVGYNLPVTLGQVTVPAGTTALIIATEPIWILIFWTLRARQAPTRGAILGALIGLFGICLLEVEHVGYRSSASFSGIALVMLGAISWSAYCVLAADLIRRKGALAVTSTTIVIGCLPFLLANGSELPGAVRSFNNADFGNLALLAFGSSVVATLLWNHGVAVLPGPRSGAFLHGIPIVGVFAGHFFLKEMLSRGIVLAGTLIVSGVILAQFDKTRRPA
jgi:drug/metabolite transporter (DMT)-like permease